MAELFLAAYIVFILAVVAFMLPNRPQRLLVKHAVYNVQGAFAVCGLIYSWQLLQDVQYAPLLKGLTLLCASFILASSKRYINEHSRHLLEYPLIFSLATLFLLLLVDSTDLISTFFSLIGFSLNLYVLILFDAPYASAREAGIKYYYLSAFSSGLILYGIFLLFALTGATQFNEVAQALDVGVDPSLLTIAITFTFIGFLFKLSAFPGHLWAPEVYEGSPDPIMGFFMLPVKIAVLAIVIQLFAVALQPAVAVWQPLLSIAAIGSLVWGCFGALYEKKAKRFLAYASINQIGFLLMGVACGTFEGYRVTLFYLFLYALMSIGFLIVFLNTRRTRDGRPLSYLTDFRGLTPNCGWTLAVVLLSMAGIPPLAGFFGKYYLLLHTFNQGLYTIVLAGLATSLISTYYYLRIVKTIWFEREAPVITCDLSSPQRKLLRAVETALWGVALSPTFLLAPPVRRAAILPIAPAIALAATAGVVLLPNPVHNLLCLVATFLATVFIYLAVKAEFLAFVFVIVYVGAVAVLFLFVIMLLNVKELTVSVSGGRARTFLLLGLFLPKLTHDLSISFRQFIAPQLSPFSQLTNYLDTQYQDVLLFASLYDEHSLLFLLVSFILLTAMIGAIVLASSALDTQRTDLFVARLRQFPSGGASYRGDLWWTAPPRTK